MIKIKLPTTKDEISKLSVGDRVLLSGEIFTGRDAVLPKVAELVRTGRLDEYGIDLQGSLMFHTAVSPAGVGPTSSNKLEIEGTMETLTDGGICIHLGKGALKPETVKMLADKGAVYMVMPPVTALLGSKTISSKVAAFDELGMEALHKLEIVDYPAIVAAAKGESIYG